MKKHMITAALVAVMALGLGTVAGCSQEAPREDVNANVPAGAPPLMPTSHDGRFENLIHHFSGKKRLPGKDQRS